ncbi:hypothetical protein KJZ71_02020 [Patescibacteria group bacterium]|uniref:Uncharacterized protein n=1 Tax=candidate division WWE3 bacterium TaxID=2053526 RepID=A0A928Y6N6_UNCKA|nr:hypothetical protein [candidate division WWE3 bacterium]MCL4732563.1 hypothetical protein [Patescibacteria group bacterium]MDL1953249.1 hypothetical protein [Candidatus Uhrbacteria bacterium UHB]RIL00942.1 MAG: hypothetical protein DCC77_00145 [Candidatus Uhrbacteria bacterium]
MKNKRAMAYAITVDYALRPAEGLREAFDRVGQEFWDVSGWERLEVCLKVPCDGTREITVHLIEFGEGISTADALRALGQRGYRPATFEEFVAFISAYPGTVSEVPIAAAGTRGLWKGCIPCHAFASLEDSKRCLTVADEWSGPCFHLAVRHLRLMH